MTLATSARPSCYSLLDKKTRDQLADYQTFGYPGRLIRYALAYIELIEEELVRREREDVR